MRLILYGSARACEIARSLMVNLNEVKRENSTNHPCEVNLTLYKPIKEASLIPLLRQSGIHGFRLADIID